MARRVAGAVVLGMCVAGVPAWAFDCAQAASSVERLVCDTPALRAKYDRLTQLDQAARQRLWSREWEALLAERKRTEAFAMGSYGEQLARGNRAETTADIGKALDNDIARVEQMLARRPQGAPPEAAVRARICRPDRFCALRLERAVGRDSRGREVFIVINDSTPLDPHQAADDCWPTEWWRITYDGKAIHSADLVVTERDGHRRDDLDQAVCDYGVGGGGEQVEIRGNELTYTIEGGSGWRWIEVSRWRLIPELQQVATESHAAWRMNPAYGQSTVHDLQTETTRHAVSYTLCLKNDAGDYAASAVEFDLIPFIDRKRYPRFDWRRDAWPQRLRVRADGRREKHTAGFVITQTRARSQPDGGVATMAVAFLGRDALLVEVEDPEVITDTGSWVSDSHIELWFSPAVADPAWNCLVPTWNKRLMRAVPRAVLRAESDDTQTEVGFQPVRLEPLYQWGIRTADGQIFPGFGKPDPRGIRVEMARVDQRRTRFAVRLPSVKSEKPGPALSVLYSTRSAEGKQHLFGTSTLRYGDPSSLGLWGDPRS